MARSILLLALLTITSLGLQGGYGDWMLINNCHDSMLLSCQLQHACVRTHDLVLANGHGP